MQYLANLDLNKNELQNARVQNLATAPSSPLAGQIFFSTTDKTGYIYDGTKWRDIAQIVDLSTKQDTLVSGENIKTINGTSILGSGNLEISSGGTYTAGNGIKIENNTISNAYGYQSEDLLIYNYTIPATITSKTNLQIALESVFSAIIANFGTGKGLVFVLSPVNDTIKDVFYDELGVYSLYSMSSTTIVLRKCFGYDVTLTEATDNSTHEIISTQSPDITVTLTNESTSGVIVTFNNYVPENVKVLATNTDYATPYTPLYNGSPATKKYVDDKVQEFGTYVDGNFLDVSQKGFAGGVASLDSTGKVPSSQLPSYVDDVIEGYYYNGNFYSDSAHTELITPETGKIYVDLDTNKTYRWGGTTYVEISQSTIHKFVGTFTVLMQQKTGSATIEHSLGSSDIVVNIYTALTGNMIIMDINLVDDNNITINYVNAEPGSYKVVIVA